MSLAASAAEQFVHQIGTGTVVHNSGAWQTTLVCLTVAASGLSGMWYPRPGFCALLQKRPELVTAPHPQASCSLTTSSVYSACLRAGTWARSLSSPACTTAFMVQYCSCWFSCRCLLSLGRLWAAALCVFKRKVVASLVCRHRGLPGLLPVTEPARGRARADWRARRVRGVRQLRHGPHHAGRGPGCEGGRALGAGAPRPLVPLCPG